MIDQVWLLVGAVGSLVVGCSNSTQSTQAITAKIAQLGGPVGTIPGMMPMRLCTNNIFTGSNSAAVVHTSDDIVVGPLRSASRRCARQLSLISTRPRHLTVWLTESRSR